MRIGDLRNIVSNIDKKIKLEVGIGKISVLLMIIFTSILILIAPAAAAGEKLVVFTDKSIYFDYPRYVADNTLWPDNDGVDINPKVYAVVLDSNGKIIKSGLSFSASAKDIQKLNHTGSTAIHHSSIVTTNGNYVNNATLGSWSDPNGDGIYEIAWNYGSMPTTIKDDHLIIRINVTESTRSLSGNYNITFTRFSCGHGDKSVTFDANLHTQNSAHQGAPCTECHYGIEHTLDNSSHGPGTNLSNDANLYNPTISSNTFNYMNGLEAGTEGALSTYGRADICVACHDTYLGTGSGTLDMLTSSSRPSCSWSAGPDGVNCHATTNIKGTSLTGIDLFWKQNGAANSKSHNHSTTVPANVSCELCHDNHGRWKLPQPNPGTYSNINEQCWLCHGSNGPQSYAPHSSSTSNCESCHNDDSGKLNVHLVPQGKSGDRDCGRCHDIGGQAGYDIDITNMGNGAHANLNNRSQFTGSNATYQKCWACHGTLNANGYANESDQPAGSHNDTIYKNPRKCPDCHNNLQSSSNFSAPQVVEHRIGAPDVPTTGTQCSLCHNNSLTAITETDGFGITNPQNATASHYLKDANANLMTTTTHSNDCTWCHITNTNNASWGTPVNPNTNFSSLHNGKVNSDCKTCHGNFNSTTVKLHDADITGGSAGGQDCVSCHEGTTGNKVNVGNMNQSDSIHLTLNSGGTSNGRVENKMCYACHTNNSYITGGVVNNGSIPASNHPTGYNTPKNCTLCHLNTNAGINFSARQVPEHRSDGSELQTKAYTNLNDSCIACHINNEMLGSFSDDSGTSYSNVSHYGKSRNNTGLVSNNVVNCKYCHYNSSSTFEFEYMANKTISNHSTNYPVTTPTCDLCHSQGRMHDGNLTIPALNDALCTGCHTTRQEHNNNVSCITCHVNSSASRDKAHPIKYIGSSGGYDISNASAAGCQSCHQGTGVSGFSNATKVNSPISHSNDNAGQKWGNYWGSGVGSSNNTAVSQEVDTTGTTTGISGAQFENDIFENMTEANAGGASLDTNTSVTSNTQTTGTISIFSNMQSWSDGGAFATMTEGGSGGGGSGTMARYSNAGSATNAYNAPNNVYSSTGNGALNVYNSTNPSGGAITKVEAIFEVYTQMGTDPLEVWTLDWGLGNTATATAPASWTNLKAASHDQVTEQQFVYNITSSISSWTDVYNIWLQATMDKGSNGGGSTIYVDAMWVNVTTSGGTTTYSMNITTDTASVPAADYQYLEIRYNVTSHDNYSVSVFDGSIWNQKGTLSSSTMTVFNTSLTASEWNGGNPRVRYTDVNPAGTSQGSLYIDYQRIHSMTAGGTNYLLDVKQNVTGIPAENNYYLTIKGKTDGGESYNVQVDDSGSWITKSTISGTTSQWYNTSLSPTQIAGGKVQIRYVDTTISSDATQNTLSVDYAGVRSETVSVGLTSCDYCHGDTRHNATALGKPDRFKGTNNVETTDLTQSTWCLGCHVNGSANYNTMKGNLSPIPPQIKSGYAYYPEGATDHSGFTLNNDNDCATCHKGNTTSITAYMHNLSTGTGCTGCHTQPPSGTERYNMTGAHDLHADAGYGNVSETGCDFCHSTQGRFENLHPNGSDNASVVPNASASIAISDYQMNPASGNDDTCAGVSCHSNGLSSGAKVGTATWNTATAGACTECHSTVPSGLPPTGNHTRHYTTEGYSCAECHGLNADAGNQTGHKTNAAIDINFTNVTGTINETKTCSVYCHSPNPTYDPKSVPTWNTSSVSCGDCHSTPPTTTRNNRAHPSSNGSDCENCHGTGATTGTQTGHLNGAIDTEGMTCATCHASYNTAVLSTQHNQSKNPAAPECTTCHTGYLPVSGHTTGNKGYIVNESNTCRNCHVDGSNGFKENHTSSSDCTQCHFANTTRKFTGFNESLYTHDHNLTVEHSYYQYNQSGAGMPLASNNGTGIGMFPQYTCSLTCHAVRNPEKVDKASSTWLNSSHANSRFGTSDSKNNCAKCKSPLNYNDTLNVTNPVIAEQDWAGIQCRVCHNLHNRSYSGISGYPVAFYNATASSYVNYSVYDPISNNTQLCEKCHEPGSSHDSKFAGPHKTTSSFTCTDCHMNANFSRGVHDFQVKNTTSGVTGCEVCHNPANHTFQFTSKHTDKVECVGCHDQTFTTVNATGYAVSGDNYYGLYKETPGSKWTTAKKMNTSAGVWPLHNLSRSVNCDKCHGAQSVYNGTIAQASGAFCEGCHSQPPSGSVRYNMTGAHDLHKSAGYGSIPETSCDYCHSTGGRNNLDHTITNDNASVVTNGSATIATYTMNPASGNDDTCAGVSCHSNGLSSGAKVGTATWNTATAGACTECHSTVPSGLPPTGNHTRHYTTEGYSCAECHGTNADAGNQTGHRTNGAIDINFTNVTGSINASKTCSVYCHSPNPTYDPKSAPTWNTSSVTCGDCHSTPPITTRNNRAHPSSNGSDCENCHGTGATTGTQAGHLNGVIDATSGDNCIACHDTNSGYQNKVDVSSLGMHGNINNTDGGITNADCKTCHYNTTDMGSNYTVQPGVNVRVCNDCHVNQDVTSPAVSEHYPGANINVTTMNCENCHSNSLNIPDQNSTVNTAMGNVTHYGTTTNLVTPSAGTYNTACNNCHNSAVNKTSYGVVNKQVTIPHTGTGTCDKCHVDGSASDLHNSSLAMPVTVSCKSCHTTYASKYNAPNLTDTAMGGSGYTTCNGGSCHGTDISSSLDTLARHNVDRTYPGTGGSTNTVYLNNNVSLSVTKGTPVEITSMINDANGAASRVGGAEYYIDTDPGQGKGIPMTAADGLYDARQGSWENVIATLDTGSLPDGNHTIYVRGVDIGKQWSAPKNAQLVVQSLGYINVTVTSVDGPVVNADVWIDSADIKKTDINGNYSFAVPAGTYNVTVSKQPTHNDNTSTGVVVVTQGNTTSVPVYLQKKPTGTISGTVTNV